MTEEIDLIRAIVENPDDDTLRLAYADWLDGRDTVSKPCPSCSGYADDPCPRCDGDGRIDQHHDPASNTWRGGKTCHECHGTGKFPPGYRPERDPASGRHEGGWTNCKTCPSQTPGFVVDTRNAHRAEFIRLQIELARRAPWSAEKEAIRSGVLTRRITNTHAAILLASADVTPTAEQRRIHTLLAIHDDDWTPKWVDGCSADQKYHLPPSEALEGATYAIFERGFVHTLICRWPEFVKDGHELVWHKDMTVQCAGGCHGGWVHGHPGKICPTCNGKGVREVPCPITAQPVRKLVLTSWPNIDVSAVLDPEDAAFGGRALVTSVVLGLIKKQYRVDVELGFNFE